MSERDEIGFTNAGNDPKRARRDGKEYEALFPVPEWHEKDLKRGGDVKDTVGFMRRIIHDYAWQTEAISHYLKGETLYQTCKNIWNFLYDHIRYKEDDSGEELRTPAVSWAIRTSRGIDCDDFSIFAGTILKNLGIPFYIRIAKYYDSKKPDKFSHVYIVVPAKDKRYIVIDGVLDLFDAEKTPIKEYEDFVVMDKTSLSGIDISLLSGVEDTDANAIEELIGAWFPQRGETLLTGQQSPDELDAVYKHLVDTRNLIAANPGLVRGSEDPQSFLKMLDYAIRYWNTDKRDEALAILAEKEREINALNGLSEQDEDYEEHLLFFGIEGLSGVSVLGKVKKKRAFFTKVKGTVKKAGEGIKQGVKDAFKAVVKVSPITVSARAGMLLALKLNIGKVAERLKWGYLTEAEAQKHGFDLAEWKKLKDRLAKSEHLFVDTMQGNTGHFKEAILKGRAGGLSGMPEEDSLGVDPVTSSATLIATALPFVKKIMNLLQDVDVKKLTARVNLNLLNKTKKEAEQAIPIPPDVKTALPDNNITPETKIAVKPETSIAPAEIVSPAPTAKTENPPATTSDPRTIPTEESLFTKAGNWIKENPGWSLLIAGSTVLGVTALVKGRSGLGLVTGKGKRKGKKKKNPPKALLGTAKKKKNEKGKKGMGGGKIIRF